jgi:ribonuclease P protein component
LPELLTLTKRSDFKAVQRFGDKWVTKAFVLLGYLAPHLHTTTIHYGIITSSKLGTAVVRNRIRRRLKEVIRDLLPKYGQEGYFYVIIARADALVYPFPTLKRDLKWSLDKIHHQFKVKDNGPR